MVRVAVPILAASCFYQAEHPLIATKSGQVWDKADSRATGGLFRLPGDCTAWGVGEKPPLGWEHTLPQPFLTIQTFGDLSPTWRIYLRRLTKAEAVGKQRKKNLLHGQRFSVAAPRSSHLLTSAGGPFLWCQEKLLYQIWSLGGPGFQGSRVSGGFLTAGHQTGEVAKKHMLLLQCSCYCLRNSLSPERKQEFNPRSLPWIGRGTWTLHPTLVFRGGGYNYSKLGHWGGVLITKTDIFMSCYVQYKN